MIIRFLIIYILTFFTSIANGIPLSFDIKDLYITSKGNNPEESKFKAQIMGVEQAFALMIDKLGLSNPGVENLPYDIIFDSVQDIKYKKQVSGEQQYTAVADYIFDYDKLESIIYKHSDPSILNKLNQCLVIPAIRQGRKIYLFDDNIEWLKMWKNSRELLKKYRIIFVSEDEIPNINGKNILEVTYDQLRTLMQIYRTHKAVIVLAQYYTDLETGNASLKVEYRYIYSKNTELHEEEFALPEHMQSKLMLKKIIDAFIAENGKPIDPKLEKSRSRIPQNILNDNMKIQTGSQEIIMSFEVYHQEEWNKLKTTLEQVSEIKNIKIIEQQGNLVTFTLTYKSSMQNLVDAMYPKKIGYVKRKGKYYLIRIEEGI